MYRYVYILVNKTYPPVVTRAKADRFGMRRSLRYAHAAAQMVDLANDSPLSLILAREAAYVSDRI